MIHSSSHVILFATLCGTLSLTGCGKGAPEAKGAPLKQCAWCATSRPMARRVLMTNLFDVALFPASRLGELYHPRWRIKVLCDNLQALATLEARDNDDLPDRQRINRAYVHTALKPLLPALLLGRKVARLLRNVLRLIAKQTYLHRENLSKPRKPGPKPHKYMTQKHC